MSKMHFSDTQELAINAVNGNVLVSAGAGSGKTAVLTERIYRLAKKNMTLDHFLVLTFTNLASGEMKARVRKKLLEDKDTISLASEVDDAHIETFDSFSLFLAKKFFYKLGISKDINILDNSIQTIQRKKILDDIFISLYKAGDKDFERLILEYCVKDERKIKDFIIKIIDKADKKADNILYLKSLKLKAGNDDLYKELLEDYLKELKDRIHHILVLIDELEDQDVDAKNISELMNHLLEINDYDLFREEARKSFPRIPNYKEEKPTDKEFREAIANLYNKKIKVTATQDFGSSEDIKDEYHYVRPFINKIVDIALEVETRLSEFKKEKNAFSFGDISRFVLKLLEDEEIRVNISNSFSYIMVDEYQDTNDIQETVINKIARNNIYMVGDVKQSIYRFRGADCHIFQEKYNAYSKGLGGVKIDLNTSYRSRKEVVDFINDIFESLMNKHFNAIDYKDGHHFEFGNKKAYEEIKSPSNYKPEIYLNEYEAGDNVIEREARIIAEDILSKKTHNYQVFDNDLKTLRNCDFKDFAIIIDRGTDFDKYVEVLSSYNIPIKIQNKTELLNSDVSYIVKSMVKLLYYALEGTYESEYKHAFFSLARSFLFAYPDDKLYEINKNNTYLTEPFTLKVELIKEKLRFASIEDILNTLFNEFEVYESLTRIGDYYENAHKLEHFLELAKSLDSLGYTIEDFVTYFDDLDKSDVDIDHTSNDVRDNSVTLINIHKSKGLEYKIIYFPGLYKAFNRADNKEQLLISDHYGMTLTPHGKEKTLLRHLILKEEEGEDFEEKLRLLYVALTRAREKIILISSYKKKPKDKYPRDSINMNEILNIANDKLDKYISTFEANYKEINDNEQVINVDKIILKRVNVPSKIIEKVRASKEVTGDVDESFLSLGTELHMYLEHLNYEDEKDYEGVPFRMRRFIDNVRKSPLFKGIKNEQIRHEFRFYDEDNKVEGYIDALIIKDDEIDIIDFKFSNIDEPEYDKQLRIYKKYISSISNLPIKMYLLSASSGRIREVKDE